MANELSNLLCICDFFTFLLRLLKVRYVVLSKQWCDEFVLILSVLQ